MSEIAWASPVVPDHAAHVQAFHSDLAVAGNQIIRNLVPVFVPQVGDAGVQSADTQSCFPAILTTSFLAGLDRHQGQ